VDFGRIDDPNLLDRFSGELPAEDPGNAALLEAKATRGKARVLFAAPVWGHPGFLGRIYPRGTPSSEYLRRYAEHFPAIELNTTWYGIRPEQVRRWADEVPDHFRFFAKLPRLITHDLALDRAESATLSALRDLGGLGEKLGGVFAQLPPDFGPERTELLGAWLDLVPRSTPLAVELRHPGFFTSPGERRLLFEILRRRGATAVITDSLGRPDVLHQTLTSGRAFVRFAGNRLHASDFLRLDAWAQQIATWVELGIEEVLVALHQPEEHQTIDLALHLGRRLAARGIRDLILPRPIAEEIQGELFGED
jgi:uncharacterized protein YecE (DUF72 family)